MENYAALRMNEAMLLATVSMNLIHVMLHESQAQRITYYTSPSTTV